jgi:hypothetical protein
MYTVKISWFEERTSWRYSCGRKFFDFKERHFCFPIKY